MMRCLLGVCGWPKLGRGNPQQVRPLAILGPMCRVLYRLLVLLARLAVRSGRSKDLVIIVLRHQLVVLHRQNSRPSARRRGHPQARAQD